VATPPTPAAVDFLRHEYDVVLDDASTYSERDWRLLLGYLGGSGAGLAALPTILALGFPLTDAGLVILGLALSVSGVFVALTVYKGRRTVYMNLRRLEEIEKTTKTLYGISDDTPWGRWGKAAYGRLWETVKKERNYKRELVGAVDYGIMFVTSSMGVAWLVLTVWMLISRGFTGPRSLINPSAAAVLVVAELACLLYLVHLARSEARGSA